MPKQGDLEGRSVEAQKQHVRFGFSVAFCRMLSVPYTVHFLSPGWKAPLFGTEHSSVFEAPSVFAGRVGHGRKAPQFGRGRRC